ncbi:uncharacterized, partial [Tachysurus ichikawai]
MESSRSVPRQRSSTSTDLECKKKDLELQIGQSRKK